MSRAFPFDSLQNTVRYAQGVANANGVAQTVFKVSEGTAAYDYGFRFGTFPNNQEPYEGVEILDTVIPQEEGATR